MFDSCTSTRVSSTYHNVEGLPDLFWSLACDNHATLVAEYPGTEIVELGMWNWESATGTVE